MTEPVDQEKINEAIEEMRKLDRLRTLQGCAGGCLKWTFIMLGIIDLFFINIAIGVLLYQNIGL